MMQSQLKRNQHGMTLIELLLGMALLAIFIVILSGVFAATIDIGPKTRNFSTVSANGRFVLARLNNDILHASSINTPALGASGSSLNLTIGGVSYTYALSGGRIMLTDGTGTDFLTSSNTTVSTLTFQTYGNSGGKAAVAYTFTITGTAPTHNSTDTQTFSSMTELR